MFVFLPTKTIQYAVKQMHRAVAAAKSPAVYTLDASPDGVLISAWIGSGIITAPVPGAVVTGAGSVTLMKHDIMNLPTGTDGRKHFTQLACSGSDLSIGGGYHTDPGMTSILTRYIHPYIVGGTTPDIPDLGTEPLTLDFMEWAKIRNAFLSVSASCRKGVTGHYQELVCVSSSGATATNGHVAVQYTGETPALETPLGIPGWLSKWLARENVTSIQTSDDGKQAVINLSDGSRAWITDLDTATHINMLPRVLEFSAGGVEVHTNQFEAPGKTGLEILATDDFCTITDGVPCALDEYTRDEDGRVVYGIEYPAGTVVMDADYTAFCLKTIGPVDVIMTWTGPHSPVYIDSETYRFVVMPCRSRREDGSAIDPMFNR
jgi:hypothetical protein